MADSLKGDGGGLSLAAFSADDGSADRRGPSAAGHRQAPGRPQSARRDAGRGRRGVHRLRRGRARGPGRGLRRHLARAHDAGHADARPVGRGGASILDPGELRPADHRAVPEDGQALRRQCRRGDGSTIRCATFWTRPGIPVFRRSDEALRFLRRYVAARSDRPILSRDARPLPVGDLPAHLVDQAGDPLHLVPIDTLRAVPGRVVGRVDAR